VRIQTGESDAPDDGSGILYHIAIEQEQLTDQKNQPIPNMLRATITATWKSRGDTEQRQISELIYQP
jgi:hypothetical protein